MLQGLAVLLWPPERWKEDWKLGNATDLVSDPEGAKTGSWIDTLDESTTTGMSSWLRSLLYIEGGECSLIGEGVLFGMSLYAIGPTEPWEWLGLQTLWDWRGTVNPGQRWLKTFPWSPIFFAWTKGARIFRKILKGLPDWYLGHQDLLYCSPDFLPVTLEIANSNLDPKRLTPLNGIWHQLVLEPASAAQGLSHRAYQAAESMVLAEHLKTTIVASSTSPANLFSG